MAGIQNLAIHKSTSATSFGSGTNIWTSDANYLCSVIATNTNALDAEIYVTIKTSTGSETGGALIAHKLPLPAYNSYETFRFGVNNTDAIYIAGPAGITYFVQGIEQAG